VAGALGYGDGEKAPVEEMLAAAARIVRAVSVPVTVDYEAGYGRSAAQVAEDLIAIGAAGLNYEDTDHQGGGLVDADLQADRIAALKARARELGADLVVNARVDVFVRNRNTPPEQHIDEGLRRARLYREAGADCVYPITLGSLELLAEFVKAAGVVNINASRGGPLTLQQLSGVGVRRVSYAVSVFREALAAVEQSAAAIMTEANAL
jgi:2-methylisocitrate lyase-like PEP mutase family enzyme